MRALIRCSGEPWNEGEVGQHRKAGRAARLIGLGERLRLEMLADEALRRARLLDLGDEPEPAFLARPLERLEEAARRRLSRISRSSVARGTRTFASAISRRL